nr:MAG TPA: hypothetical protein [Caudoviricetes sp.]
MNGIVTGKIEKIAGSMVFKSEQSVDLSHSNFTFDYNALKYIRIIDKSNNITLICVKNFVISRDDEKHITLDLQVSDYVIDNIYCSLWQGTCTVRTNSASRFIPFSECMNSLELGTLEIT